MLVLRNTLNPRRGNKAAKERHIERTAALWRPSFARLGVGVSSSCIGIHVGESHFHLLDHYVPRALQYQGIRGPHLRGGARQIRQAFPRRRSIP
jgi:hypothetical protein